MPKSYEPMARVDFSMADSDTGDCLRVSKSSPNVHLDWSSFSGSGNFPIRRGLIGDFTNFTTLTEQTSKTYNDQVLDNTTSYWYDIRNKSLTDSLYFYHADHLGTPIAMTDSSGMLVWRAEHLPFGGIYALTVGTISNNLRFPGQYYDSEMGLYQNWFRDYDAKIGRYREVDSVKSTESLNNYGYADNNPTVKVDFYGLQGSVSSGAKQTVFVCCASANIGSGAHYGKHCYVQVGKFKYELQPKSQWLESMGYTQKVPAPIDPNADCAGTTRCNLKDCVDKAFSSYPSESHYLAVNGPNSNTFAAYIAEKCKLNIPKSANSKESPGWGCAAPR
jgi:RHS repeat-associated protein